MLVYGFSAHAYRYTQKFKIEKTRKSKTVFVPEYYTDTQAELSYFLSEIFSSHSFSSLSLKNDDVHVKRYDEKKS